MLQLISTISPYAMAINLICHLTVFIGGLYIAIHSRSIPNWLRTCLWYIGCSSFLVVIMMLLGWIFGHDFELSYVSAGIIAETMFNFWVCVTTFIFFLKTVAADVKFSKKRLDV